MIGACSDLFRRLASGESVDVDALRERLPPGLLVPAA